MACVKQLGLALAHCHARGVVHRDVKPNNVLIDDNGVVRLADFGFSRRVLGQQDSRVLSQSVCTPWYTSPEVLLGMSDYGPGVDLWATGCVLWELATGERLFQGQSCSDINQLFTIFKVCSSPRALTSPRRVLTT